MGTRVEQSSEFLPRASRTSRRHLEDMADSLHRLPSAAEDLQVIIPRCNRTLLLQGEFCITLLGSSKPKGSRAGRRAISIGASRPEPVRAIAVYESERDGCTRGAGTRVSGDRLSADRFAGDLDPLFPFIGGLWFLVGVQQQSPAERTAALLRLKDAQPGLVQRGFAAASPFGPVLGQGWIVWRRGALDHLVPDDGCPGE